MRKRQRAEHRKRKILKLDEEGVSLLPYCQLMSCPIIGMVVLSVDCTSAIVTAIIGLYIDPCEPLAIYNVPVIMLRSKINACRSMLVCVFL